MIKLVLASLGYSALSCSRYRTWWRYYIYVSVRINYFHISISRTGTSHAPPQPARQPQPPPHAWCMERVKYNNYVSKVAFEHIIHTSFSHALYKRTNHINNSMVYWFQNTHYTLREIKHKRPHMSVFDINFNVIAILIIHINLTKKALPAHCTRLNAFLSRYSVRGYSIFVHASLSHIFAHPHINTQAHTHSSLIIVLLMATTTGGTSKALFSPHSRIFHCSNW